MSFIQQFNCKVFLSSIICVALISSCQPRLVVINTKSGMPVPINIKNARDNSGKLIMRINGKNARFIGVNAGVKIQWNVTTHKIQDLTKIYIKAGSSSIFVTGDPSRDSSKNWKGEISGESVKKIGYYNIDWTDNNGIPHTYDPKIQVQ